LADVRVKWQKIDNPVFTITQVTVPILVTSLNSSSFTIDLKNINQTQFQDYQVDWSISPPLANLSESSLSQNNTKMTVVAGAWQSNTNYSVSASVTHKIFSEVFS
jgi:hypothetical protein